MSRAENKEKYKEYDHNYYIKHKRPKSKIGQAELKISDLETKLAESEKKNFELVATINLKEHKPAFCTLADRDCEALGQVEELKQQLAEKNKEIENIKLCRCVNCKNEYEFMLEGLVEDLEKQIDKDGQEKISFAVEQLEKVKEFNIQQVFSSKPLDNFIDNQIKQLKEMK